MLEASNIVIFYMKKAPLLIIIIFLVAAITAIWFYAPLRSLAIMSFYSTIHSNNSKMVDNEFKIKIPSGKETPERDWSPLVMTFNADYFKTRNGEIEGMSILYNFPAFNLRTGQNPFFDPESPYNSSFYGAYVVESSNGVAFGYGENEEINYDEILHAFRYDYVNLVLADLGEKNFEFSVKTSVASKEKYLGYYGWEKINAEVQTNSVSHISTRFRQNYIQYGSPPKSSREHFPGITMYGRLYIRYFPEFNSTVIMYVMSPDIDVINNCDENLLSKSEIIDKRK